MKKHLSRILKISLLTFFLFCLLFNISNAGNNIEIKGFDPGSGRPGDLITISGFNFYQITSVLFGSIQATVTNTTLNPQGLDLLEVKVPENAVTGKITIKTASRGTAVSDTEFTVDSTPAPSNLKWWFVNFAGYYIGPFETPESCRSELAKDKLASGSSSSSDCVQKTAEAVKATGKQDEVYNLDVGSGDNSSDNVYKLLAPIGNLKEVKSQGGKCPGNPDLNNGIGCYLNIIFLLAIGICGVLAVVMIVISGIQYMGDESVFGKTEAKSKILSAILGLFIALGAYLILNTINPDLTGKNGVTVDQVESVIVARDRADDPDFMNNIDSFDISNITINPSDYNDPSFLGYLAHQQGTAGASAILWAAKKGYTQVPANNPFARGDIARNMRNNFNPASAQKTIGTSTLTTANFLKYWAVKVAAVKRKTTPAIPSFIDSSLVKVSGETGVDVSQLRTMCRIESAGGCTTQASITTVNKFGYSGLFQLSKDVFNNFGKKGGTILDAYHNTFAAAQFYKSNLNGVNKNWPKINK